MPPIPPSALKESPSGRFLALLLAARILAIILTDHVRKVSIAATMVMVANS